jgi:hypothetical protein
MYQRYKDFLTLHGIFCVIFFWTAGAMYFFIPHGSVTWFEAVINFCTFFIVSPWIMLWYHRKSPSKPPVGRTADAASR